MLDMSLLRSLNNVKSIGRKVSVDEITVGFQGRHARLKIRCGKFKRAGDGFQVRFHVSKYVKHREQMYEQLLFGSKTL